MTSDKKLIFDFNWKLSISVLLVFPMLVKLSLWQVDRADEKSRVGQEWKTRQSAAPLSFDVNTKYLAYQRVNVVGQYAPEKYWLKENQFYSGQLGYNVVMPFITESGVVLAVDRGWVAGTPMRDFIPEVETPGQKLAISGTLVIPSDSKLIREAETRAKQWPHKILEVDLAVMGKQAEYDFYPQILRIDPDSQSALVVYWKPINMSPAKHYGYAVQWGLMALALIILYAFASSNLSEYLKKRFKP